jgi:translation elongation factor EF-G
LGSNVEECIKSIEFKLNTKALLLTTVKKNDNLGIHSVIDIIKQEEAIFDESNEEKEISTVLSNEYKELRNKLVEAVCDFDDEL